MKTIIQQEIDRLTIDKNLDRDRKRQTENIGMRDVIQRTIDNKNYAITILESLLEPEREQLIDFGTTTAMWSDDEPITRNDREYHKVGVVEFFNEQFKPE